MPVLTTPRVGQPDIGSRAVIGYASSACYSVQYTADAPRTGQFGRAIMRSIGYCLSRAESAICAAVKLLPLSEEGRLPGLEDHFWYHHLPL